MTVNSVLEIYASGCQPIPFDGGMTLGCAATITNVSQQAVIVQVSPVPPTSTTMYVIVPGQSLHLGSPSQGSMWTIVWWTQEQVQGAADWGLALAIGVGALAGIGLADLTIAAIHHFRRRR